MATINPTFSIRNALIDSAASELLHFSGYEYVCRVMASVSSSCAI